MYTQVTSKNAVLTTPLPPAPTSGKEIPSGSMVSDKQYREKKIHTVLYFISLLVFARFSLKALYIDKRC